MTKIKLNQNQVAEFLLNEYFETKEDGYIVIDKNDIIINKNGLTNYIKSATLNFYEDDAQNIEEIEHVKNLLCEHLNIENSMLLLDHQCEDEIGFRVKFDKKVEPKLIVVNFSDSLEIINSLNINSKGIISYKNFKEICYKQLSNSQYYFRWISSF